MLAGRSPLSALLAMSLFAVQLSQGQNDSLSGTALIDYYLVNELTSKAEAELQKQMNHYLANNQADSLYQYPYYVGKIWSLKSNTENAAKKVEAFISDLENNVSKANLRHETYINLADFYDEMGMHDKAFAAGKRALDQILLLKNAPLEQIGSVRYNIGISAYSLDKLDEAKTYFKSAVVDYESSPTTKKEVLADAYNAMGAVSWTFNKLDSAQYYYEKAVKAVESSSAERVLKLYLATVFRTNIALLQESKGNVFDAIEIQKGIIRDCKTVVAEMKDEMLRQRAMRTETLAISNLGAMYHDLGHIAKAKEILRLAYTKKEALYEPSDVRLTNNLIQIAQAEYSLKEYDQSLETVEKALKQVKTSTGDYISKKAELIALKGDNYYAMEKVNKAAEFYRESSKMYAGFYSENFSREYLIFLRKYAVFLAEKGEYDLALEISELAYDYALKNAGDDSLLLFNHMLNLGIVNYTSERYKDSRTWAQRSITLLENKIITSRSALDSIQIEYNKPKAILLQVKSDYQTGGLNDTLLMKSQLKKLSQAVAILERRKTTVFNNEDVLALLADYEEINDFAKTLSLKLFDLTENESFLNKTISLHESGIYNRIRTKFNLRNNLGISNVPQAVINRENSLKRQISSYLNNAEDADIETFFNANDSWNSFLDSLGKSYPAYYKMRYATIETSLNDLSRKIPPNSTLIRYFFIGDKLFAFVADKTDKTLVPLEFNSIKENIAALNNDQNDMDEISKASSKLYRQLWQPIVDKVKTRKIIIFPDKELFNLSFEMLCAESANNFKDFAEMSLLSNHTISYNYSLSMIQQNVKTIEYGKDFVAFAPEFTSEMKRAYTLTISDSTALDKTYLTLLPQPFSADLAKRYSNYFEGSSFLNEKASKQVFTKTAKEHKIIHIGTHAESNNLSPELSRLIFAKNADNSLLLDDNSLYTYEIYNYNLSSNLAILTACETGKPTYQSGEGMISLAHAFNYAGSESILTSLWKIDEKSSSEIIALFYTYLSEGLSKDEALQQAKLNYINTAEGRTIHPQYWAGLVLMGDASPIDLSAKQNWIIWVVVAFILLMIAILWINKLKKAS